jgi:DNA mismatch repair protein MutS2
VLLARRSQTLVSTHIGKLKEFAFRHPRAENACVEFDPQTLAPCYHLIVGVPGESGALVIARRLGMPAAIVERAKERLVRRDEELTKLMADMCHARTEAEKARGAAVSRLEDAERMRVEAVEQKRVLEQKSELLEAEAQQSIEERVRNAAKVLERARALVEQLPAAQRDAMAGALSELEGELSGSALSARRAEFLAALKKGSFVYVPRYKQRLAVQKVDRPAREVTVQLGNMRMRVSFDEVSAWEGR